MRCELGEKHSVLRKQQLQRLRSMPGMLREQEVGHYEWNRVICGEGGRERVIGDEERVIIRNRQINRAF